MHKKFRIDPAGGLAQTDSDQAQVHFFTAPTEEEKDLLVRDHGLDPYDLDSALDADEDARLEFSDHGMFALWKSPLNFGAKGPRRFNVGSIGIHLDGERLVFVSAEDQPVFEAREFRRVRSLPDVLLGFLLHSIRHYVGHLRVIRQVAAEIEDRLAFALENKHLLQMFAISESLVYYGDAIEGNGVSLGKLRNAQSRIAFEAGLMDDIVLENNQAAKQASLYGSVMEGLIAARESLVNNNMNTQLRSLTLINIVFLPLNLIAGIGGMSEWSMMTRHLDWKVSYGIFVVGITLIGWLTWTLVRRFIEPGRRRSRRP